MYDWLTRLKPPAKTMNRHLSRIARSSDNWCDIFGLSSEVLVVLFRGASSPPRDKPCDEHKSTFDRNLKIIFWSQGKFDLVNSTCLSVQFSFRDFYTLTLSVVLSRNDALLNWQVQNNHSIHKQPVNPVSSTQVKNAKRSVESFQAAQNQLCTTLFKRIIFKIDYKLNGKQVNHSTSWHFHYGHQK